MSSVAEDVTAQTDATAAETSEPQSDRIAYYPGCSLKGTSREFDESLRAVVEALDVDVTEIDDWNCCGATSGHTTDHLLGVALPARNLALAEAQGFNRVLAPCAACYNRLAAAHLAVANEEGLAERMPEILGRPFENSVEVFNAIQLLRDMAPAIKERVAGASALPNPLGGVKLAAYYGCLLVRPADVCGYDDPEQPTSMDEVISACGAEPVDWNMKVECCGGSFSISRTASVVRLGRAIVEDARRNGAEAIVVACPMCHSNLDLRQKAMTARGEKPLPVLYITEVVGLALGLPAEPMGMSRHFVATEPFLKDLVARAEVRAVAEKKAREEAAVKAAARAAKRAAAEKAAADSAESDAGPAAERRPAGPEGGDAE